MTPQELKDGATQVKFRKCQNQEAPMVIRPNAELQDGTELEIVGFPFVLAKDKKGKLYTLACHEVEEEK